MIYDLIIVGGRLSGLSLASFLADSDLKVLLLTRSKVLGADRNPARGTFMDVVEKYGLEDSVICKYDTVEFFSPKNKAEIKTDVAMLGTGKLLNLLKKRCKCEIKTDTEIVDAKYTSDYVELFDTKGDKYVAKLVVDASGTAAVVAQALGLKRSRVFCACYIVNIKGAKLKPNVCSYYASPDICNSSSWIEPLSDENCQLGIADYIPLTDSPEEDMRRRILVLMKRKKPFCEWLADAEIIPSSEEFMPIPVEPMEKMVADNLIVLGDAAGQATPMLAEGIRPILDMSEQAAQIIKESFSRQDFSRYFLKEYEDYWWEKYADAYWWGILLRHFVAKDFTADMWDCILDNLENFSLEEKDRFLRSDIDLKLFLKLLSGQLTSKMIFQLVNDLSYDVGMVRKKNFITRFA